MEPLVRAQFLEHQRSINFGAHHLEKWIGHPHKNPISFVSPSSLIVGVVSRGGGGKVLFRSRADLEQS